MTTAHAKTDHLVCKMTQAQVEAIEESQNLSIAIKKLTEQRDGIDRGIRDAMGDAMIGMFRNVVVCQMVPWGPRRTIDGTRFRQDHPELAEQYTNVSEGYTLRYPGSV